ncbi:hypothetical protein [Corallococcus exercitus]|uniref:hypothetical protein n=1 Tax=Corallococcus exercitus TaxID=2316736 RepID=UPI0020A4D131|nr:hypothetical protein [Corallococcus exercitus]
MPGAFANPTQLADQADFENFEPGGGLPPLRERLLRLERERGIMEIHRRFSDMVLAVEARLVETPRYMGTQRSFALSPDGWHLASASERLDRGGDVRTYGPAIRRDNLAPYVGQTMLLRLVDYGDCHAIGTLREVTKKGGLLDPPCPSYRSFRDPVWAYDEILWIGPAVPLEGPETGP